jgi:putative SOS response-associated peptidase YedK
MCSQFNAQLQKNDLTEAIGLVLGLEKIEKIPSKVFPGQSALVIREKKKNLEAELMNFSLIPSWSLEPKVKFATHNARLETVLEKATWKTAFQKRHCLIPMSGFIEPIYEGELGGNMVEFLTGEAPLFAAGIWEDWVDKKNEIVISSFSILTTDPYPLVEKAGHDRSPIFLSHFEARLWVRAEQKKGPDWVNFLIENKTTPNLKTKINRPLKTKKTK